MKKLLLFALLLSAPARAGEPSLEVSLKTGGHFPQLTNKLGTSFDGILKVGYAPTEGRQLQLFVEAGYTQPSYTLDANDARLGEAGADYSSTLTVRDLRTTLGAAYFFTPPSSNLLPYVGAGLRAHFVRSDVRGAGGEDFGQNSETATLFGGALFGGLGLHLGPGILLGELNFGYAPTAQKVTGISNIGALSVLLGYGLLL